MLYNLNSQLVNFFQINSILYRFLFAKLAAINDTTLDQHCKNEFSFIKSIALVGLSCSSLVFTDDVSEHEQRWKSSTFEYQYEHFEYAS